MQPILCQLCYAKVQQICTVPTQVLACLLLFATIYEIVAFYVTAETLKRNPTLLLLHKGKQGGFMLYFQLTRQGNVPTLHTELLHIYSPKLHPVQSQVFHFHATAIASKDITINIPHGKPFRIGIKLRVRKLPESLRSRMERQLCPNVLYRYLLKIPPLYLHSIIFIRQLYYVIPPTISNATDCQNTLSSDGTHT